MGESKFNDFKEPPAPPSSASAAAFQQFLKLICKSDAAAVVLWNVLLRDVSWRHKMHSSVCSLRTEQAR